MPWLVILGSGSWGGRGYTYKAGVHEIPDEHAAEAQAFLARHPRASTWLVLSDTEPKIERVEPGVGPLGIDDVRIGTTPPGVRLAVEAPEPEPEPEDPDAPPLDYQCPHCVWKGPAPGPLARHIEFNHSIRHLREVSEMQAAAEAERQAREEEQRLRAADPRKLPVWEREAVGVEHIDAGGEDAIDIKAGE